MYATQLKVLNNKILGAIALSVTILMAAIFYAVQYVKEIILLSEKEIIRLQQECLAKDKALEKLTLDMENYLTSETLNTAKLAAANSDLHFATTLIIVGVGIGVGCFIFFFFGKKPFDFFGGGDTIDNLKTTTRLNYGKVDLHVHSYAGEPRYVTYRGATDNVFTRFEKHLAQVQQLQNDYDAYRFAETCDTQSTSSSICSIVRSSSPEVLETLETCVEAVQAVLQ